MSLSVIPMAPEHLMAIKRHPDQQVQCGIDMEATDAIAADLAGVGMAQPWGEAWACFWRGDLVACLGLRVTFGTGTHAVAWAVIADGIGPAHLAVTRFARSRVESSPYRRIEATTLANDAEILVKHWGPLDAQQLIEAVMVDPTPECRLAKASGLLPAHVMRVYGADAGTYMLFERIAP